ncbi:hypothetical protein N7468_005538 [Penicillium chermesinum]|uniref:Uncharacterized protein n=1 Tax=Penicillium chermesinum TaxID=63820 RepID=A0A9W9TNA4_9EURO|nr:uncharacterized protein N7468_005538 [Penicillium chermesinum]KAJ5232582.1 hypothetical protein N7468_005538 [Penicillium chermesinum]KAJ6172237.1 hypothetical protein N7470_001304 [Penicillium chermesinum]
MADDLDIGQPPNETEVRDDSTLPVQEDGGTEGLANLSLSTTSASEACKRPRRRKLNIAELSTIVEEEAVSGNLIAGIINPAAVRLTYKRMANVGDEALPRALREMPEDIRQTHDLDEGELVAVIKCRVRIRKQFQVAFTKEGHLRQRFVTILDRKDEQGQPIFGQDVINSNCPKREIKRIASQNPLLFTSSGRLLSGSAAARVARSRSCSMPS